MYLDRLVVDSHTPAGALIVFILAMGLAGCSGGPLSEAAGGDSVRLQPIPPDGIPKPARVSDTLKFTAVATGYHHSCALQADGSAWCWGSNEHGQLGSSAPMERCAGGQFPCSGTPLQVESSVRFTQLAASIRHTCGLDAAGQASCWGFGQGGQLGDGQRTDSSVPVAVAGGHEFSAIATSVGGSVTCALTKTGTAWCWGPDFDGVLGNGTRDGSAVPAHVATSMAFISISVGQQHACGVVSTGDAYCWGVNWFGQLGVGSAGGDGGLFRSTTPVPVSGGLIFSQIAAGGEQTCALTTTGKAYCWGLDHLTGMKGARGYLSAPVAVDGDTTYSAISAGFTHTCALGASGTVDCWGENFGGELGNGTFTASETPVRVASSEVFADISAHGPTCAVTTARAAWCWGANPWGGVGQPPSDP